MKQKILSGNFRNQKFLVQNPRNKFVFLKFRKTQVLLQNSWNISFSTKLVKHQFFYKIRETPVFLQNSWNTSFSAKFKKPNFFSRKFTKQKFFCRIRGAKLFLQQARNKHLYKVLEKKFSALWSFPEKKIFYGYLWNQFFRSFQKKKIFFWFL